MKILNLLFGDRFIILYSFFIGRIMRLKGIKVGSNFRIKGVPTLDIKGSPGNIVIGNDVFIQGDIDLRNRQNGKITFCDRVKVDVNCRFVAANDAHIKIDSDTNIGCYTIFNAGADIFVGKYCLISGFCYIQSSNHGIKKDDYIRNQPHTYGPIKLEDDVWVASHVTILPDVTVSRGAVLAAKSVINKDVSEYEIVGGVPALHISNRHS